MNSNFDIEAAKAGEPVEMLFGSVPSAWEPVHFIGLDRHAQPVFQREIDGVMFPVIDRSILRMAPKKIKVRYRSYLERFPEALSGYRVCSLMEGAVMDPEEAETDDTFVQWIHTDWQEAEIEQ